MNPVNYRFDTMLANADAFDAEWACEMVETTLGQETLNTFTQYPIELAEA